MDLLTVGQVAQLLKISTKRVYQMIAEGQLESLRVGRLVRVRRTTLDKYLAVRLAEQKRELGLDLPLPPTRHTKRNSAAGRTNRLTPETSTNEDKE